MLSDTMIIYISTWVFMKKGFTLIELSIVLIIIGLLVAGISGGAALIKQAQSRRVISAIFDSNVAFNSFVGVYDATPGDMVSAADIWPSCGTTAEACNGNGNGNLDFTYTGGTDEALPIIKHLELAGLLNVGVPQLTETYSEPLQYLPRIGSELGFSYTPTTIPDPVGPTFHLFRTDNFYAIMAVIGKPRTGGSFGFNGLYGNAGFTPADAYAIDHKIDDGAYDGTHHIGNNTGKIWTIFGGESMDAGVFDDCIQLGGMSAEDPGSYYIMGTERKTCVLLSMIRR